MPEKQQSNIIRRSRNQVDQLVAEYETSTLSRDEFCRKHGLSAATLHRYRQRRQHRPTVIAPTQLVAVEIAEAKPMKMLTATRSLFVITSTGRRIEVGSGFDPELLIQLLRVLEQL
jgi:transposase-like protein